MNIDGLPTLVADATGELGSALSRPHRAEGVVAAILGAVREDRREVSWDLKARELVTA